MLNFKDIKYNDIPEIELYMDQVTSYLDSKLENLKKDEKDKVLTKTMINNYVKAGIIDKPIKKKYNRNHMAKMIMVYFLKNIVSINEVEKILDSDLSTDEFYDRFSKIHNEVVDNTNSMMKKEENNDKLELVLHLLLQADINKRLAEEIIKEI